jgi:hypothetical protein
MSVGLVLLHLRNKKGLPKEGLQGWGYKGGVTIRGCNGKVTKEGLQRKGCNGGDTKEGLQEGVTKKGLLRVYRDNQLIQHGHRC